jgi:hypothetical protein
VPSEKDKSKEQKAAEPEVESFRKDLGPFVVAAETARMAMVFTGAKESNLSLPKIPSGPDSHRKTESSHH